MRRLLSSVALLGWLSSVGTAQAQTVYSNGAPIGTYEATELTGGWYVASQIVPERTATISSFGFWSNTENLGDIWSYATIWWWFLPDNGAGYPVDKASALATGSAPLDELSPTDDGSQTYYYEVPVPIGSLELNQGTQYWLGLSLAWSSSAPDQLSFGWRHSALTGNDLFMNPNINGYKSLTSTGYEHAFIVNSDPTSTVPEPVGLLLLGSGLLGVAAARRRRRR